MTDNAPSAALVDRPDRPDRPGRPAGAPREAAAGHTGRTAAAAGAENRTSAGSTVSPARAGTGGAVRAGTAAAPPGGAEAAHIALGRRGEELAARFLDSIGVVVLSRNWRCEDGELDIVGTDRTRLIVCEVKTRSGTDYGPPAGAVTDEKACRIRRLAARWRALHGVAGCDTRFDIVSVLWPPGERPTVEHLKAAF